MKISERCKKQIEQINQAGLKLKESEYEEPYDFVMWNSDFESIMELYLSYEDTIKQLNQTEHLNPHHSRPPGAELPAGTDGGCRM